MGALLPPGRGFGQSVALTVVEDGKCDDDFKLSKKLNYASQTFMTLRPKHRPSRRECPKC